MRPGDWKLVETEESTEQIPGRPQFVERRVIKTYRASFRTGARIEVECPCGDTVSLLLEDEASEPCKRCGRTYSLDLAVVRVDDERIPPAGMGK